MHRWNTHIGADFVFPPNQKCTWFYRTKKPGWRLDFSLLQLSNTFRSPPCPHLIIGQWGHRPRLKAGSIRITLKVYFQLKKKNAVNNCLKIKQKNNQNLKQKHTNHWSFSIPVLAGQGESKVYKEPYKSGLCPALCYWLVDLKEGYAVYPWPWGDVFIHICDH